MFPIWAFLRSEVFFVDILVNFGQKTKG